MPDVIDLSKQVLFLFCFFYCPQFQAVTPSGNQFSHIAQKLTMHNNILQAVFLYPSLAFTRYTMWTLSSLSQYFIHRIISPHNHLHYLQMSLSAPHTPDSFYQLLCSHRFAKFRLVAAAASPRWSKCFSPRTKKCFLPSTSSSVLNVIPLLLWSNIGCWPDHKQTIITGSGEPLWCPRHLGK